MPKTRRCNWCGSTFTSVNSNRSCTEYCRYLHRQHRQRARPPGRVPRDLPVVLECAADGCTALFEPGWTTRLYCSNECRVAAKRAQNRDHMRKLREDRRAAGLTAEGRPSVGTGWAGYDIPDRPDPTSAEIRRLRQREPSA